MNQNEAVTVISAAIPEVTEELTKEAAIKHSFALIRIITCYTRKMVAQHNEQMIEKCLKLVDRIYTKGDLAIKNAIENVFIFSLDHILFSCSAAARSRISGKIPLNLYTGYVQQIYKSGI